MYVIKAVSNESSRMYWNDEDKTTTPYLAMATKYNNWTVCDKRCEELNNQYKDNPLMFFHRKPA